MSDAADEPTFRIRIVPVIVTILLGLGLPIVAGILALFAAHYVPFLPRTPYPTLSWLYWQHAFQLLLALIAIVIAEQFVPADYGLHTPRGKT